MSQPWFERFDAKVAASLVESAIQAVNAARALLATSTKKKHQILYAALDHPLQVLALARKELKAELP